MKKFAFYVSNNGTRLKKFLQVYNNISLIKQIEFVLIDNCNNDELRNICNGLGIIYYEVNLKEHENKNKYISNFFLEYLNKHNVDNAFIFADRILLGDLLVKYKNRLINFHPAILPSHKGLFAIDQALKSNTFLLGNSAHIVTDELDGGRVIMQNIFPSINFKNYDEVLDKQLIMILQLMVWIERDKLTIDKNNNVYIRDANYEVKEFIPNLDFEMINQF
ncbi:formyltransferase family protein [Aliarcobacter butzleri]|uniref:formyltransferase family protein n=1 Tax=Aliarcobacter butzleri TaxID=28197 RepID=UPI0021B5BC46|nr:formyltransferase family protein [Aliarcobacter butzleri]MCT7650803.1 formyltransferase family protein [Aliarcobacter butzleri]